MKTIYHIAIGLCAASFFACAKKPGASEVLLTGKVQAGPVKNAELSVNLTNRNGTLGNLIGKVKTFNDGSYSTKFKVEGTCLAAAEGGTYTNEADDEELEWNKDVIQMKAFVFGNQSSVTPVSTIIAHRILAALETYQTIPSVAVEAMHQLVVEELAEALGVNPASLVVKPADPKRVVQNVDDPASIYALILAAISQAAHDEGIPQEELVRDLAEDFRDGNLDSGRAQLVRDGLNSYIEGNGASAWRGRYPELDLPTDNPEDKLGPYLRSLFPNWGPNGNGSDGSGFNF